ncbi:hypothetical protein [Actinoalloteichus sp. GBA129-24]|uniref:hypothetical protein n=1 Tax=Actinoalloteichus sp. GBA129-24 TaxID=1612551 RepID=UPI0012F98379|nr:hypothetical protein [Actinoalloteichus sp. GBA129-24]
MAPPVEQGVSSWQAGRPTGLGTPGKATPTSRLLSRAVVRAAHPVAGDPGEGHERRPGQAFPAGLHACALPLRLPARPGSASAQAGRPVVVVIGSPM